MTDPIRVVVADDHPVFRDGLPGILASAPGLEVLAEAGTGLRRTRRLAASLGGTSP